MGGSLLVKIPGHRDTGGNPASAGLMQRVGQQRAAWVGKFEIRKERVMQALTLYSAYKKAVLLRGWACDHRGSNFGIAIDTDKWARIYQRYDRLARKLDIRILEALGSTGAKSYRQDACWFCGWLASACSCKERNTPA